MACQALKRGSKIVAINSKDRFATLPAARQEAILARAEELMAEELTLAELREARLRSQATLAKELGVQQAAISKLSAAPTCT